MDELIPFRTDPLKKKKSQDATARSITRASFMTATRPTLLLPALEAIRAVNAVGSLGLGNSALGCVQDVLYQVLGVLHAAANAHQVIEDSDTMRKPVSNCMTDTLSVPLWVITYASLCSRGIPACVIALGTSTRLALFISSCLYHDLAGMNCGTNLSTPPSDSARVKISVSWQNLSAAACPPWMRKESMPPPMPSRCCFRAIARCGCESRPG